MSECLYTVDEFLQMVYDLQMYFGSKTMTPSQKTFYYMR